jgi:hypothetical protein
LRRLPRLMMESPPPRRPPREARAAATARRGAAGERAKVFYCKSMSRRTTETSFEASASRVRERTIRLIGTETNVVALSHGIVDAVTSRG